MRLIGSLGSAACLQELVRSALVFPCKNLFHFLVGAHVIGFLSLVSGKTDKDCFTYGSQ